MPVSCTHHFWLITLLPRNALLLCHGRKTYRWTVKEFDMTCLYLLHQVAIAPVIFPEHLFQNFILPILFIALKLAASLLHGTFTWVCFHVSGCILEILLLAFEEFRYALLSCDFEWLEGHFWDIALWLGLSIGSHFVCFWSRRSSGLAVRKFILHLHFYN